MPLQSVQAAGARTLISRLQPNSGLAQREPLLDAQIGPPALGAFPPKPMAPENISLNRSCMCAKTSLMPSNPGRRRPPPRVPRGRTVVDPALLLVRQDLVGLVDLLELRLGRMVALVAVGMVLQGLAPVGLAEFVDGRLARRHPGPRSSRASKTFDGSELPGARAHSALAPASCALAL